MKKTVDRIKMCLVAIAQTSRCCCERMLSFVDHSFHKWALLKILPLNKIDSNTPGNRLHIIPQTNAIASIDGHPRHVGNIVLADIH